MASAFDDENDTGLACALLKRSAPDIRRVRWAVRAGQEFIEVHIEGDPPSEEAKGRRRDTLWELIRERWPGTLLQEVQVVYHSSWEHAEVQD